MGIGRLGLLPLICLALRSVDAGSATWNLNPTSSDWNAALNWTPNTVPNGPADVASSVYLIPPPFLFRLI